MSRDQIVFVFCFITIYSIQYKYMMEIKIIKQTESCGEGDNQKRNGTILGMSPLIKMYIQIYKYKYTNILIT